MSDQKARDSEEFDCACLAFAREFVELQTRVMRQIAREYQTATASEKPFRLDQKAMNQMALSVRKMQEVGRMALGETTDRKQLDLGLSGLPTDITFTVTHAHAEPEH